MESTINNSDFVADIDAYFGSSIVGHNRDQILLNFINAKNDNYIKTAFEDHYKQLYDSYKSSKRFDKDVVIRTFLTPEERRILTESYPGLRLQFTNEDKNPHAFAKASRVLEFHNILHQRIRCTDDKNISLWLESNAWDAYVKDCGGDPTALLHDECKYLHVCAPVIGSNSYDSVRYTHRLTSLINRSKNQETFRRAQVLLNDIQTSVCNDAVCCNLSQNCNVRAPFLMFIHSIYDMTLTDIADAMDSANALMGYATIIYSDEILIKPTGTLRPLNVWWEYSNSLTNQQWNPENTLYHTDGEITFGFEGDDGFNYTHSLANYKSFFFTSRFKSSNNTYYSLELQENRNGIQYIRFSREIKEARRGVTHTLNLRSLENKYLISMYDVAPDFSEVNIKPNSYRSSNRPWLSNNYRRLIPYRFTADKEPIDHTINYLSSVKSNLKPNECLNYLRNYCTRNIHNGSAMDARLNMSQVELRLLTTALYLNVYDSNFRSGKIVQQAVNDLDVARSFSYGSFKKFFVGEDFLNVRENSVLRSIALYLNNSTTSTARILRCIVAALPIAIPLITLPFVIKRGQALAHRIPKFLPHITKTLFSTTTVLVTTRAISVSIKTLISPLIIENISHFINTRDMIVEPTTKYTFIEKIIPHRGSAFSVFVPSEFVDDDRTKFAKNMIKTIHNVDVDTDELSPILTEKIENRTKPTTEQSDRDRMSEKTSVPEFEEIKRELFPRSDRGACSKLVDIITSKSIEFSSDSDILEIGVAPGSWAQHLIDQPHNSYTGLCPVGRGYLPMSQDVLDVINSSDRSNLIDVTIENFITNATYSHIFSDAAGHHRDYTKQSFNHDELFSTITQFSVKHLRKDGIFVVKLFDLTDTVRTLALQLKSCFSEIALYKPPSSKPLNPEAYLVAIGFGNSLKSFSVFSDHDDILASQKANLTTLVDAIEERKTFSDFEVEEVLGDGNCCFRAANLNRVTDIIDFKKKITVLFATKFTDLPDLREELSEGQWGGSAFLQAFGEHVGVKYIVHDASGNYSFGASCTRFIHLKRESFHYSILHTKHHGTSDEFPLTSFPPFIFTDVVKTLTKYINFTSVNSKYKYSGNMDHFCNRHTECRNNSFGHVLSNAQSKDGLIFFIEKHSGHLDVKNLNHFLQIHDLHLRLHVLNLSDHYIVSTHNKYHPLSPHDFDNLDQHLSNCYCANIGYHSDSTRSDGNLVYYCHKYTKKTINNHEDPDLVVELVDQCTENGRSDMTYAHKKLLIPITADEMQKVVNHPNHVAITSILRQNFDNTINSITIRSPIVNPAFAHCALSEVYPRANITVINLTGGTIRLAQVPLIENSIESIIINTMSERREIWGYTVSFTIETLQRYHKDMTSAHSYGRPLFCKDNAFHLYSIADGQVLMGSGIDTTAVRWGYDGKELISFDSLSPADLKKATKENYVSFNKHSVLLQSYYHYQRSKGVSINDVRLHCKIHPIQGIPGAGKTEHILRECKAKTESILILTVSRAAKIDIQERATAAGLDHNVSICTFDSFMINYDRNHANKHYQIIWFDEARLTHAGDWLWAAYLTKCRDLYIVGDVAQIPYIERTSFIARYSTPKIFEEESHNLSKSHRCPQDIVNWMRVSRDDKNQPFYDFPISTSSQVYHSVSCHTLGNIASLPRHNAQYLVYTQEELRQMVEAGFTNCRTIHQYQGNQNSHIILVRLSIKDALPVYKSMAHMLVAFTRHTKRFEYYTCCPVEKDITYKNVKAIMNYSDNDLKLRAGGINHYTHEVVMPRTQQPYLYPKIVRELNDKYGFGCFIPMRLRRIFNIEREAEWPKLQYDPLAGYKEIISEYVSALYHVPSGIDNTSDHDIYATSDKQFYGDYSLNPIGSVTKERVYARPLVNTSSRLRTPINQPQVLKAFCERNGAVPEIKGNVDSCAMADMLVNTVIKLCDKNLVKLCSDNPISANNNSIATWMARQPLAVRNQIASDLETIDDKDLTRYQFTIKGNAKPDLDINPHLRYKSAQTIAYQDKSINAIFCPIMADFTERLVAVLNPNILLFNRLSNSDYVDLVNNICPYERFLTMSRFFEIDFSKFDKSQDQTALEFECSLMRILGVPHEYVSRWFHMHVKTTLVDVKNKFKARVEYQRKSGDAGTWVLNTVFQMAVVINTMRLETEILNNRCFATFSGDDSLIFIEDLLPINVDHVSSSCANIFNLEVKLLNFRTPYFCSKFFLPTPHGVLFVPDVIKTLVKLGRRDLISVEHAREYYISFSDNNLVLSDAYEWPTISKCISDRYMLPGSHTILIQAIATIATDVDKFLSLWDFDGTKDTAIRPNLDI